MRTTFQPRHLQVVGRIFNLCELDEFDSLLSKNIFLLNRTDINPKRTQNNFFNTNFLTTTENRTSALASSWARLFAAASSASAIVIFFFFFLNRNEHELQSNTKQFQTHATTRCFSGCLKVWITSTPVPSPEQMKWEDTSQNWEGH